VKNEIAIIGSAGRNAAAWTESFLTAGFAVRGLVRNAAQRPGRRGVDYVEFDLDDHSTYERALDSLEILALVTPADPRQTERELGLIGAAKKVGVRRILNLSVIGADLPAPISPFARWQAPIEAALSDSGLAHVTLRPNSFMQNILLQRRAIEAGRYGEPLGAAASSLIDVRDIADVAVLAARGDHDGEAVVLTGPEALRGDDIARILSEACGRAVTFASPSIGVFRKSLVDQGAPAWRVDALAELYEAIQAGAAGHVGRVAPGVEEIIGRPPRAFRNFAQEMFGRVAPGP
jgi:uncharacterized protein YbjT (DUF2867 family)